MEVHRWFLVIAIFLGILFLALVITCRMFSPL